MDSRVLFEILKSMSRAVVDAMSIVTAQTLGLQQLRQEAAIESAAKGFLTDEAKRKLRLLSFTSKLLFDGQFGTIYKENMNENQETLIRHAVNQALPVPNIPVGGRLAHFTQNWAKITDDKWVLSLVRKGYRIPFLERPILSPDPVFFLQPLSQQLEEEVASLLSKGAVKEIIPECPGYYSRIFLVPKKNRKCRLIIDLSVLNHFVHTQTFKIKTQRKVKDAVQLNDWAFSLDLTNAYLHIPIHHRSHKYLRFTLRG